MKVFITGISGFLSINLVRFLISQGYMTSPESTWSIFHYPERDRIHFVKGIFATMIRCPGR